MKIKLAAQNVHLVHKGVNSEASKQFFLQPKCFALLLQERSMCRQMPSVFLKPQSEENIPTMRFKPR